MNVWLYRTVLLLIKYKLIILVLFDLSPQHATFCLCPQVISFTHSDLYKNMQSQLLAGYRHDLHSVLVKVIAFSKSKIFTVVSSHRSGNKRSQYYQAPQVTQNCGYTSQYTHPLAFTHSQINRKQHFIFMFFIYLKIHQSGRTI